MPIYQASEIPGKIRQRFESYVDLARGEELVLLYDRTIFGSGKKGLAVTDRRLIPYVEEQHQSIRYGQLVYAYHAKVDPPHHLLVIVAADGQPTTLDIYTDEPAHLDRIVGLIRQAVSPGAWAAWEERLRQERTEASTGGSSLKVVTRDNLAPVCPHCERPLDEIFERHLTGLLGVRFVYFCPRCRKVLGFSHRQGYIFS
jgi:hypothetical protein